MDSRIAGTADENVEFQRGIAELRDGWNALRNQVVGRGTRPRKDVSKAVVGKIESDYAIFRRWYADLGPAIPGTHMAGYQRELARYQAARQLAENKLPKGEVPQAPDLETWVETESTPWWKVGVVLIAGGLAGWLISRGLR